MSLWTPYADTALDLSKPVQQKPLEFSNYQNAMFESHYVPQDLSNIHLYQRVYADQMSPVSASSSFERFSPLHMTLSPPQSPVSQSKRSFSSVDAEYLSDDPDFQAFERDALRAMAEKNGGILLGNNPRMRRTVRSSIESSDDAYRRQRERNNFAAKQSRDRRKLRELHLALKVSYLKKEVANLKSQMTGRLCVRCQRLCLC